MLLWLLCRCVLASVCDGGRTDAWVGWATRGTDSACGVGVGVGVGSPDPIVMAVIIVAITIMLMVIMMMLSSSCMAGCT